MIAPNVRMWLTVKSLLNRILPLVHVQLHVCLCAHSRDLFSHLFPVTLLLRCSVSSLSPCSPLPLSLYSAAKGSWQHQHPVTVDLNECGTSQEVTTLEQWCERLYEFIGLYNNTCWVLDPYLLHTLYFRPPGIYFKTLPSCCAAVEQTNSLCYSTLTVNSQNGIINTYHHLFHGY